MYKADRSMLQNKYIRSNSKNFLASSHDLTASVFRLDIQEGEDIVIQRCQKLTFLPFYNTVGKR